MAAKMCLRCDWTGTTASSSCPRCGSPLFASGGVGPKDSPPEKTSPGASRSWRGWIATLLVVAIAATAFVVIQFLTPSKAPSRPPATGFHGYLVYAAAQDEGEERLWIWDLASDTVQPGPEIHSAPTALVSTYAVEDTWIGLTVPTGIGTAAATVLRSADANADPVELGEGQFVAWPDGGAFVSILRSDAVSGCREHLQVTTVSLVARISVKSLDRDVCGRAVGLVRDSLSPYVTMRTPGVSIDRVGGHRLNTVLRGYEPLGVSANGDFLVRTPGGHAGMYYPSPDTTRATMITLHGQPFDATRVLAWSTDGNIAYVLGSAGGVHGVFAITVGPRPQPSTPALIFGTQSKDVAASITSTNDLFFVTDGIVHFVHDGALSAAMPPPPGAPDPSGPLLWVLSLPYSPSVTP
ncbi:MAG TPA: hypothetical protein VHW68_07880 [Actinomycetota bacterium]|jgi:hypothetical protein|nr:hypothetical protein [Actinomycetota bacterium]